MCAAPDPMRPLTVLSSSPLTASAKSVTTSPLCVRPFTVALALGGNVISTSPLLLFASTPYAPANSMRMLPSRSSTWLSPSTWLRSTSLECVATCTSPLAPTIRRSSSFRVSSPGSCTASSVVTEVRRCTGPVTFSIDTSPGMSPFCEIPPLISDTVMSFTFPSRVMSPWTSWAAKTSCFPLTKCATTGPVMELR